MFEDLRYKDLSNNCLVIVIVYGNNIDSGVTNKAIVVVYIKLWTVGPRIEELTKKFN